MPHRTIVLADYNPAWAEIYLTVRKSLAALLGDDVIDICHVGSTAVPGLCAKSKVDIDIVLKEEALPGAIERMQSDGYEFHGDKHGDGMWAFSIGAGSHRGVRVYLCAPDNGTHQKRLFFRDYLRNRPDVTDIYNTLKRALVADAGNDPDYYADGKAPFIAEVTSIAAVDAIRPVVEGRRAIAETIFKDLDMVLHPAARELLLNEIDVLPMVACIAPDGSAVAFASFMVQENGEMAVHFSGVRRSWQRLGLSSALVTVAEKLI